MAKKVIHARFTGPTSSPRDLFLIARDTLYLAEEQALHLMASTRKKLAEVSLNIRNRARRRGYQNGSKAAYRILQQNLLTLQEHYEAAIKETEQECLTLAFSIAEEILHKQLKLDHEPLTLRIKGALKEVIDQRSLKIRVTQGAEDTIYAELTDLLPEQSFSVIGSSSVEPGNAVIETISGNLELRWEDHLSAIRERLRGSLTQKQTTISEEKYVSQTCRT